jgi:hypothetical protein
MFARAALTIFAVFAFSATAAAAPPAAITRGETMAYAPDVAAEVGALPSHARDSPQPERQSTFIQSP